MALLRKRQQRHALKQITIESITSQVLIPVACFSYSEFKTITFVVVGWCSFGFWWFFFLVVRVKCRAVRAGY